ncbi:unnamed protein product [Schistocephalus solidus]|uniref:Uncharacterized protein n=1 Tax=Schistocephalus solidus TaxID=70667 RepID=A0A183TJ04_SCHSO|nr:unnamed protein product [Schistocephalus solidus]
MCPEVLDDDESVRVIICDHLRAILPAAVVAATAARICFYFVSVPVSESVLRLLPRLLSTPVSHLMLEFCVEPTSRCVITPTQCSLVDIFQPPPFLCTDPAQPPRGPL